MRIFSGCLLLVRIIAGLAPTSEELRKMYGASTNVATRRDGTRESETFLLSPNIELIVQYGSDKQACIMTLEPRASAPERAEEHHEWLMSSVRISEILEQIAPADKRGEKIINGPAGGYSAQGLTEFLSKITQMSTSGMTSGVWKVQSQKSE